jgi:hypothetical protein
MITNPLITVRDYKSRTGEVNYPLFQQENMKYIVVGHKSYLTVYGELLS